STIAASVACRRGVPAGSLGLDHASTRSPAGRRPESVGSARSESAACMGRAPDISCLGCMGNPTGVALLCVLGCWLHPEYTGAFICSGMFRGYLHRCGLLTRHF